MDSELLRVAAQFLVDRRPYALATVVGRERPSSASPGNTAVIGGDGSVYGWIGGSCTQPEVVRQALAALADGRPRLLGFGASPSARANLVPVPMPCGSEGKVEVHVNPVFPVPQMVVVGSSPIAEAVTRLARAVGYRVATAHADKDANVAAAGDDDGAGSGQGVDDLGRAAARWAARAPGARLFAVVATMGRGDEQAVQQLVAARPDYLGLVASPKRMRQVRGTLSRAGVGDDQLARVHAPAGLDIGAESPAEVAVSIFAEIVAVGAVRGGANVEAAPKSGCCAPAPTAEVGDESACGTRAARLEAASPGDRSASSCCS